MLLLYIVRHVKNVVSSMTFSSISLEGPAPKMNCLIWNKITVARHGDVASCELVVCIIIPSHLFGISKCHSPSPPRGSLRPKSHHHRRLSEYCELHVTANFAGGNLQRTGFDPPILKGNIDIHRHKLWPNSAPSHSGGRIDNSLRNNQFRGLNYWIRVGEFSRASDWKLMEFCNLFRHRSRVNYKDV